LARWPGNGLTRPADKPKRKGRNQNDNSNRHCDTWQVRRPKLFVREAAYVFITGRRQQELDEAVKAIGRNVTGVQGDVSKLADLDRLYETVRAHGRIDIVLANAGVAEFAPLEAITEEPFDRLFSINVKGTLFTVQKALPLLNDGGSIIVMGSVAGVKGTPAFGVYGATKAAIRNFVRAWTMELKERRIAIDFYLQPTPPGIWENSVTIRSTRATRMYEPRIWVPRLSPTPLLMVVALSDTMTATDLALAAYQRALEPKRVQLISGGHFAPYLDQFPLAVAAATEWFSEHPAHSRCKARDLGRDPKGGSTQTNSDIANV
jgi:NADP-dependent 3-hydroxy acid dehydrogenase YdfG